RCLQLWGLDLVRLHLAWRTCYQLRRSCARTEQNTRMEQCISGVFGPMTAHFVAAVFLVLGLGLTAWLFAMVRSGSGASVSRVEDLEGKIEVVDVIAFRNLVDPSETELLRKKLSPEIFRKIQRR